MNTTDKPDRAEVIRGLQLLEVFYTADENQSDRELIQKALSLLTQQREVEKGWQPIELAPKDGTCILAILRDSDVPAIIRWNNAEHMRELVHKILEERGITSEC